MVAVGEAGTVGETVGEGVMPAIGVDRITGVGVERMGSGVGLSELFPLSPL
jgi:hypothetical protein